MAQSSNFSEKLASLLNTFMSDANNFDESPQSKQSDVYSAHDDEATARTEESTMHTAGEAAARTDKSTKHTDETAAHAFRKKISSGKKKQPGKIIRSGTYIDLTNIPFDVALAYRTLGVDAGADLSTVRKIFRQKIKEIHPDKNLQRDEKSHDSAEKLIAAYEKIKNWFY